jgi:molybdopterin molybdotransferase
MAALSVAEALARILSGAAPTGSEPVPLEEARGRILAEGLAATLTQPPFPASAMDGYAVRAADVVRLPATLRVTGESAAGHAFAGTLAPQTAVRIFTGAAVPLGADAIVIQENTHRPNGSGHAGPGEDVIVHDGRPDPAHFRPAGYDFREGDKLLATGTRLDARTLTLAAAMGHATLPVYRRPVVAILATGDELVPPGTAPGPGQIVSSNPYGLAALVEAAGGRPKLLGIAGDTPDSLAESIAAAAGADILVTTGGASVGDHDLVAPALERAGMALDFWKIAMRPGKPLIFGRLGGTRVLGLPGNPVSTLVCGRVFLVPLIEALSGRPARSDPYETALLAAPVPANGPRQHYMRAELGRDAEGRLTALPATSQDSFALRPFAAADALLVRPVDAPPLPAGAPVPILRIDF